MLTTIKYGDRGDDVTLCQTLLRSHGHLVSIDGLFGTTTHAHVKTFQANNDLTPDGIVGLNTWSALLTDEEEIDEDVYLFATSGMHPCTHLAAVFVFATCGMKPSDPLNWEEWRALDPESWDAINIWEGHGPWDGPPAVDSLCKVGPLVAPLEKNRWYFVQRWNSDFTDGHSYMIKPLDSGMFRVVQSSTSKGYRDEIKDSWSKPGTTVSLALIR